MIPPRLIRVLVHVAVVARQVASRGNLYEEAGELGGEVLRHGLAAVVAVMLPVVARDDLRRRLIANKVLAKACESWVPLRMLPKGFQDLLLSGRIGLGDGHACSSLAGP